MRVVTFGEIMLRLQPEDHLRLVQCDRLEATFGGAEANVAVSLANFGVDAAFVSKLPAHEVGQSAVNALRRYGVDTSFIVRGGERVGIYFSEKGASQRPGKVIYDRKASSVAEAVSVDFDWDAIFEGADWFHFTGITPALSPSLADIVIKAAKAAKSKGLTVSCDLNYRKKLWSKEEARIVMGEVCKYVDICIANEEDAGDVFGIKSEGSDVENGQLNAEGYIEVARRLAERFGFMAVAITMRESLSASDNRWGAMLYTADGAEFSRKYSVHIVDRVGGGDSFAAGLIYAMGSGYTAHDAVEFATAASCLKHSVEGDFNLVSLDEVKALAAGNAGGRVQR